MAKVRGLRGPTGKGESGLKAASLDLLVHLPPNQSLPALLHSAFSYYSDINRGLSLHHLFQEKVNLELLDNKSPGHNKSVSIQNPL